MKRVALLLALASCKARRDLPPDDPEVPIVPIAPHDAAPADAPAAWPELADFPHIEPTRVIALPVRADAPRFEVGGPAISGDLAIVASSQFGFVAVDWRRGTIAWTKAAGAHVAPPLVTHGSIVLIGECLAPPAATDDLIGCLRLVTAGGADQAYVAIHGKVPAFAASFGTQDVWPDGEGVRWRRGEAAVSIDLVTGLARSASAAPPPLAVAYKGRHWDITRTDTELVATGSTPWHTRHPYSALLGSVWLPDQSPMIRVARVGAFGGHAELDILDIDATGSLHGQAAFPVPGQQLLGYGMSTIGDAAIAVRLDRSLRRDFIVGYAANALLMWVYPLPELTRVDPVGVAIASEAVVVFHDGDTVTILPELSAPPTAPGAGRAPSQNPTP